MAVAGVGSAGSAGAAARAPVAARPPATARPSVSTLGTAFPTAGSPRVAFPVAGTPSIAFPTAGKPGVAFPTARFPRALAPGSLASNPQQIATYPTNGDTRVAPEAVLYFVFDQPTLKSGIFTVYDLDSGTVETQLNQDAPRWSALGDTVYLKPTAPMALSHHMKMQVELIIATDTTATTNLPIIYFSIFPRAHVERIPPGDEFTSVTLIPGTPVPIAVNARETAGDAATFTSARVEFWPSASATLSGGSPPSPLFAYTVPVAATVPAFGSARITAPVTLPRQLAQNAASGLLGLRVRFDGYDETGLPYSFQATSAITVTPFADTLLTMSPAQVTPAIASDLFVREVIVEAPLPGAMFAAGDTVQSRAVVTGYGTGAFRAVFYIDGQIVAMEEGYMESGRPVTVAPQGPIPSRRFGEHRFQFVVEAPQNVAAQPLTILCVPPAHGILPPKDLTPPPDSIPPPSRLTLGGTWLLDGMSAYENQSGSVVGWSAWNARYDLTRGRRLEANVLWRVNFTDPENGSASPEQMLLRAASDSGSIEWGDITPSLAAGAPLFASPVPRRSAQAVARGTAVGKVEAFVALDSHPRSSAGPIERLSSDLYAGRVTRAFGDGRFTASLYGGYMSDDPTTAVIDSLLISGQLYMPGQWTVPAWIYGGMGLYQFAGGWTILGDIATVHREGVRDVAPAESRTAVRGTISGTVAGIAANAEAFRYEPNLATALNPYALSDRKGFAADLARDAGLWRFFGGYRTEKPDQQVGQAPVIEVTKLNVGARLKLNDLSWVTPAYIQIENKGTNTDFIERRAATEFTAAERGGRTTARIDIALFEDLLAQNSKLRIVSGSLVATGKQYGGVSTTISGGYESRANEALDLTDQTIQAALEMRIEAKPGKFLVIPLVTWIDRDYESLVNKQQSFTGRLQLALLRVPHLGDNALALEGRITTVRQQEPIEYDSTEGSVTLTLGQRFQVLGAR